MKIIILYLFINCTIFIDILEKIQKEQIQNSSKENKQCLSSCFPQCQMNHFDEEFECIQQCLFQCNKIDNEKINLNLQDNSNKCLNGLDPSELTIREQLIQFAKGPCNPVILVPGVMGTKLTVEINCEDLQKNEPKVFNYCGWNSCEKSYFNLWKSVPKKEYLLWIPEMTSPMSLYALSESASLCFGHLIKRHINLDGDISTLVIQRAGVRIKLFGFTEDTNKYNNCGDGAIGNLVSLPIQLSNTTAFTKMQELLKHQGYISGLTMQSLPYNFYLSYQYNELNMSFMNILKRIKKYTGKKVTIVAHSMGNINIMYQLSKMSQSEKDEYIHSYVPIAPPYLGSSFANKVLAIGDNEFTTLGGLLGFHFKGAALTTSNQLSLYELLVKNYYDSYKDQQWFQNVLKRIEYEKGETTYENSGILFWPEINRQCFVDNFCGYTQSCYIGLENNFNDYLVKIKGEEYNAQNYREFLNKYNLDKKSPKLFDILFNNDIIDQNPGVPVYLIFSRIFKTLKSIDIKDNYFDRVNNYKFPDTENESYQNGDGTVPIFSLLLLPLKWAHEYDEKKPNTYPVKFIDYCSDYNTQQIIYDEIDIQGNKINHNSYISRECKCSITMEQDSQDTETTPNCNIDSCTHSAMISDPELVDIVLEILLSNQRPELSVYDRIREMNENDIINEVMECKFLKESIFGDYLKTQEI